MQSEHSTKITIALAEDHPLIREQTREILEMMGFAIPIVACHGTHLMEQLAQAKVLPDICLTDIRMPEMDGFTLTRLLKEKYPSIKILANSMDKDAWTISKIREAGADAFIDKGRDFNEYKEALLGLVKSE